jgi:hypothetical protein
MRKWDPARGYLKIALACFYKPLDFVNGIQYSWCLVAWLQEQLVKGV